MQLEGRPELAAQLRAELIVRVAEELVAQTEAGAMSVSVESADPAEGEAYRVVLKSDKLDEPKVIAVRGT